MRYLSLFFLFAVALLTPSNASAQTVTDLQNRSIVHIQADVSKRWFLAGWTIGNVQRLGTDNINLFGGIGYRGSNWWLESMLQRQWRENGRALLQDNRFQLNAGKVSFYAEMALFLDRRAVYEMVIVERNVWRRFNAGIETESVHRPGRDSVGAGPRVGATVGSFGNYRLATALAYRVRRQDNNELRLYLVLNRRF